MEDLKVNIKRTLCLILALMMAFTVAFPASIFADDFFMEDDYFAEDDFFTEDDYFAEDDFFAEDDYFTEDDYDAVDNALRKLFAGSGCLLPYSVFCVDKVTLGRNEYMGTLKNRITEDHAVDIDGKNIGDKDRYTEDDIIRVI